MTTQHRPVSVTRAGQGASATVAYGGGDWRDDAACLGRVMRNFDIFFPAAEAGHGRDVRHGFAGGKTPGERYKADDTRGTRRRWAAA